MSPALRAKPIGSMVIVWSLLSFGGAGFAFEDDSVDRVSPGAAQAGDCGWDNDIVPNGFSARALSPPNFPDIRVVDDVVFDGACSIGGFQANVIEDDGWIPGEIVEIIVYAETDAGRPGAVLHSVTTDFMRIATGDRYFGREDYEYGIDGLEISLDPGTYWLGFRNPEGSGSGTNYWMTSDGGSDGIESDTAWFSLDSGNSWARDGRHHAFVVNAAPTRGACCERDASCGDDVPVKECDARFVAGQLCADLNPPCGTGACCAPDGTCVDAVLPDDCSFRYADGVLCADLAPPCTAPGACCDQLGTCKDDVREDECSDRYVAETRCADLNPPCEAVGACCSSDPPCERAPAWRCDGDVDGDGQVNPIDSGLVQAAFGETGEQTLCQYDVDCDGQINPVDWGLVRSLFGSCETPRSVCVLCDVVAESACRDLGGQFAGGETDCPRSCSYGACCVNGECAGTMRRFRCEEIDGQFFDGEDCDGGFECS